MMNPRQIMQVLSYTSYKGRRRDRDQVVRLWRDMGLTCLQVADGDF